MSEKANVCYLDRGKSKETKDIWASSDLEIGVGFENKGCFTKG